MTTAFTSRRLALLAALASTVWLAACGGGGGGGNTGSANVRALNLTSDLASIDIYTSDTKRFTALATDTLAPNVTLDANTYTLNVKRAGDGATLLTGSYALAKDQNYTAVVWGRETALRLSTLPENENTADIATGNTRVRFFNATTDTGAVDVFITAAAADLGETSATQGALASGSLSGFRDLSQGTYRLRVTGVGDPNDIRLDIPAITLKEKTYATLVLTAGASGVLVNGSLIEQQGAVTTLKNTKARMRVVASVNSGGLVNVAVGGRTLAGGLRSPSVGPYTLVDAGTAVDLTVNVNGAPITTGSRSFAAGTDYTLLTYGAPTAAQVQVLADDNRLPTSATRVKVRLMHAAAGTDPLTLSIDYLALASDIASGSVSPYATTNSNSSVRIDVNSASGVDALFSATDVNLQGQSVYTVFMLGGNAAPTGVIRKER
ncbi:MAG: hypothetical protein C0505_01715 [Leptothrix sp. (in: Bacteria)]|nr:hypothetical protein [Leptothrix sp. (in: b-proteobacteria)]